MDTIKILKKDCVFNILTHATLSGTTGMWKQIKMTYKEQQYFMYHSLVAFRRKDQVSSFSAARKFGYCQAQRVIDNLPNKIEIFSDE